MDLTLVAGLFSILGVLSGLLIGHYLEEKREKSKMLAEKKLEVYSGILTKLSTSFQDKEMNLLSDPNFEKMIAFEIAKTVTVGRLIAPQHIEDKLREYYDVAIKWWGLLKIGDKKEEADNLSKQMTKLVIDIENLMRIDLGTRK